MNQNVNKSNGSLLFSRTLLTKHDSILSLTFQTSNRYTNFPPPQCHLCPSKDPLFIDDDVMQPLCLDPLKLPHINLKERCLSRIMPQKLYNFRAAAKYFFSMSSQKLTYPVSCPLCIDAPLFSTTTDHRRHYNLQHSELIKQPARLGNPSLTDLFKHSKMMGYDEKSKTFRCESVVCLVFGCDINYARIWMQSAGIMIERASFPILRATLGILPEETSQASG
jgi:hypothetical protein